MTEIGDVTLLQYVLVAVSALFAGVLGGIAGYGSGVLVLMVLVPIVGAHVAVPVVSAAAILSNASRLWVFWKECDVKKALVILAFAVPTTTIGAWWFTRLTGKDAMILIGSVLVAMVPLRYYVTRLKWQLDNKQLAVAAAGYGILTGTASGAGVMLISMLMWAGLTGTAVIATDAMVTLVLVMIKSLTFHTFGSLPVSSMLLALLIGLSGTPGAFIAKWLAGHLSLKQHTAILDGVVILAGSLMIWRGLFT